MDKEAGVLRGWSSKTLGWNVRSMGIVDETRLKI
jgi:hypothetical protein